MNLNYIIGLVGAALVCIFGMVTSVKLGAAPPITINFANLINFFDPASILIVIGCTIFIVVASFPGKMLKSMPKHFKIILNNKLYDPGKYIDQLVDLAQIARKNGLLALEEKANSQEDPFFKQAIMLIVDAYDQDKVRSILENDIGVVCPPATRTRRPCTIKPLPWPRPSVWWVRWWALSICSRA